MVIKTAKDLTVLAVEVGKMLGSMIENPGKFLTSDFWVVQQWQVMAHAQPIR